MRLARRRRPPTRQLTPAQSHLLNALDTLAVSFTDADIQEAKAVVDLAYIEVLRDAGIRPNPAKPVELHFHGSPLELARIIQRCIRGEH